MLKIILFLATFAVAVWLPIVIYIVLDNNKPAKLTPETKIAASVAHRQFGKGSNVSFDRYLERKSTVEVKSVRDMCEWLLGCEYMPDQEFFNQSDLWQHPVDFETTRKGDCEDHSLWAWRKFYDMGIQAEFVVGKIQGKDQTEGDHTWIILKNGSEFHIMETTLKRMEQFFVPSSKANNLYRPIYGMDTKLRSFVYKKKVGLRS